MRRLTAVVAALLVSGSACASGDRAPGGASSPTSASSTSVTTTAPHGGGTATPPQATPPPVGSTAATGDAASLTASLVSAEQAIRDRSVPASELEGAGRAQQDAYRQLVDHPEWTAHVLAQVPPSLRPTVQANVTAGTELRALTKPRTSLPPWRIVAPAPAHELLRYYKAAEAEIGIAWEYLAAIHLVETRMGRIRGTSVAGAQGPMQFLPDTWRQYGKGGDINSNRDAIFAAARLLRRNGGPGNMGNALFNYNRSRRYVNAVTAYAGQMKADERAYLGYYHWQVYYRLVDGDRLLPVGYGA